MNGTFNQAWDYVAEERQAEYQRRAARRRVLQRARDAQRATHAMSFPRLFRTLQARFSRARRPKANPVRAIAQLLGTDRVAARTR